MNKRYLIVLLLTVGLLQAFEASFAHVPFRKQVGNIKDPHGEPLTLEQYFEDGFPGPDPNRLQIRNKNGTVIAHTPIVPHLSYFCPSIKYCWAFPTQGLLVEPWYLDYRHIDYQKKQLGELSMEGDYLELPPEYEGFKRGPKFIKIFSPLILIGDCLAKLFFLPVIYFVMAFLSILFFKFATTGPKLQIVLAIVTGAFTILPGVCFTGLLTLVSLFITSTPLLYKLISMGITIWIGLICAKMLSSRILFKKDVDDYRNSQSKA